MRIGVIADWVNPTIERAFQALTDRGEAITLIFPERERIDLSTLRVEHDLYLLKSGADLALSLGGALHVLGARTLNPYPVVALLRNKLIVTTALQQAGILTPETAISPHVRDFLPMLATGPLILKPYRGSRSEGIIIVHTPADLAGADADTLYLAQRYMVPDGLDHKLFRIGDRVFGVRRRWPLRTYADKFGVPFDPDPALTEIAMRVGAAFGGISLYGLDVIYSRGQPYVVDVNKFGSYMGIPDGWRWLADYLYLAVRRDQGGS